MRQDGQSSIGGRGIEEKRIAVLTGRLESLPSCF